MKTNRTKEIDALQQELNSSNFKCCTDCTEAEMVVYVTAHHILISDKKYAKNQMVIPFAEFRRQYEERLKALDNGDSKIE